VLSTEKFTFSEKLEGKKIYLPGQEESGGVLQKARYIVPAGCADQNLMTCFPEPIKENFCLPGNR
jgi:hypothetical protein